MSPYPKRRERRWDGDAVRTIVPSGQARGLFAAMFAAGLPGASIELVLCGQGDDRCRRHVLGTIVGDAMLPMYEASKLPDGTWELGAPWPESHTTIDLPATVWCNKCGTLRRVKATSAALRGLPQQQRRG